MDVEIRASSNVIKNSWEGYIIKFESFHSSDTPFKYGQEKAGRLGMFLMTITTEKTNIFPTSECKLKIYVNNELVDKTLLEVSPGAPYTSQILEKCWKKSTSSKILKDGSVDSNYIFEVKSYEKYKNLCEINKKLLESLNTIKTTISLTESSTDFPTSGTGSYTITSSINSNSN